MKRYFLQIIVAACLVYVPAVNAQWITWGAVGNPQPCVDDKCTRPATPDVSKKEDPKKPKDNKEVEPSTSDEQPSQDETTVSKEITADSDCIFVGVDSDKWQAAVEAVCNQRGIPMAKIYDRLGGKKIACTSSRFGSYAGCTWGYDGGVTKVDIVPSNCYDVESVRRHEAAHVVTFLIDGASSLFVHEGVSQICERGGRRRTYLIRAARQMDETTNFIDWVNVNAYDSAYRVYSYSFAVFEYLREAGGSHWLEGFVNEASRTNFSDALFRWYRLTPKDLNANVRELIERDTVRPII